MATTRILLGMAFVAALLCGINSAVAGCNHCAGCNGCAGGSGSFAWHTTSVYSLPPCMAPGYGSMMGACCPTPAPSCCDTIWDGYCTERRCCGKPWWCRPTIGGRRYGVACTPSAAPCAEPEATTPEPTPEAVAPMAAPSAASRATNRR
ncbi:MAG: hypothetical protein GX621_02455 [Pirellulaceae bacterium]|nr:hypothetical protein [Pirellulaceae bacterium]